jgi:hypothetical protein
LYLLIGITRFSSKWILSHSTWYKSCRSRHDPVVALLALDCERHGLVSKPLDKTLWSLHMTPDALYDEHWLLSYEANIKNWLPSVGGGIT